MTKRYTDEQDRQWQKTLPKKKVAVKVIVRSNEDPKIAAIRESKEEANIDIDPSDVTKHLPDYYKEFWNTYIS